MVHNTTGFRRTISTGELLGGSACNLLYDNAAAAAAALSPPPPPRPIDVLQATTRPDVGRAIDIAAEAVNRAGIIFVASAGNAGGGHPEGGGSRSSIVTLVHVSVSM